MKNPFNLENLANLNCVVKIDPHHLFKTHVKRAYWSFDQAIISLSSQSHQLIYYPSFLPFLNKKIHTESISFFLLHTPFLSLQNPNSIAFTPFLPTFEIWRSKPPSKLSKKRKLGVILITSLFLFFRERKLMFWKER